MASLICDAYISAGEEEDDDGRKDHILVNKPLRRPETLVLPLVDAEEEAGRAAFKALVWECGSASSSSSSSSSSEEADDSSEEEADSRPISLCSSIEGLPLMRCDLGTSAIFDSRCGECS